MCRMNNDVLCESLQRYTGDQLSRFLMFLYSLGAPQLDLVPVTQQEIFVDIYESTLAKAAEVMKL